MLAQALSPILNAYLARYAEAEARAHPVRPPQAYENVLVAPCYDESADCLHSILGRLGTSLLLVLVINAPTGASSPALERTRALWRTLGGRSDKAFHQVHWQGGIDILAVNRTSPNRLIPRRQGVGLARKIGADIACALVASGQVHNPWIGMTDADAIPPHDYFDHLPETPGCALMPFRHQADAGLADSIRRYELHLRYYVNRLQAAGSPYASHTIGSTIVLHAETCAKVRGVPKRNAGEDFHLLNKAAKVAPIHALGQPEITIRARLSKRVPFGTGPALARINAADEHRSYAPASFDLLAEVISHIDQGEPLSGQANFLLGELGYLQFMERARAQHRCPETLRKAAHQWFDGLRTLRFIHLARHLHPDASLENTLNQLFGRIDHLAHLKRLERQAWGQFGVGSRPARKHPAPWA